MHRLEPVHSSIDKRPNLCGFLGVQKPRGRTARGPKRSKEGDPTLGVHGVLEPEPQDRIRKIILATP